MERDIGEARSLGLEQMFGKVNINIYGKKCLG